MNAEEAIKKAIEIVREERCSCACTIHNTNTTGETCDDCGRIDALMGDLEDAAALIRSQADDLKAIEKCARIDGGFMAWELADKTIMVEHGFNIEPGTGRRGIGATVADALANTTAPKAN